MTMTRLEIDALLEQHRAAFERRDDAALAAGHVESGTFHSPAAGLVEGRHAIRGVYEYWLRSFPDLEFTWGPPIVDGDRLALFWHFRGTAAGEFFGDVKPGTRVEFDGAGDYLLSPEGIVSVRHVFDFTGALVNAGVLKVKPA
jgi:predicted ester cyclase